METIYKLDSKSDYDILTCLTQHNNQILGHQGTKFPFLTPKLVQNTRNLQKTGYK